MKKTLVASIVAPLMLVGCVTPVAKYEQWGRMSLRHVKSGAM